MGGTRYYKDPLLFSQRESLVSVKFYDSEILMIFDISELLETIYFSFLRFHENDWYMKFILKLCKLVWESHVPMKAAIF